MLTNISFALGLLGSAIGVYSFITTSAINAESRFKDLEAKAVDPAVISDIQSDIRDINNIIDTKVEPVWNVIIKELPKILISPHTPRFDELVYKYTNGIEEMTHPEMCELIDMLTVRFDPVHTKEPSKAIVAAIMREVLKKKVEESSC